MNILHEVKRLMKPSSDKVVDQLSDYKNMWVFENHQQETALEIIKNLLRSSPEFSGDDLLISADMDEMVSRDVLQSLKGASVEALDNFQQGNYHLPNIYLWMNQLEKLEAAKAA